MGVPIEIIPAIRWIELDHVGCWTSLRLEFIPGLNIITEEAGGLGKTTILWAILRAIHPSSDLGYPSPTLCLGEGRISVEFTSPSISVRLNRKNRFTSTPEQLESKNHSTIGLLQSSLEMADVGTAVLFDDDVLAPLDCSVFPQAVQLLNATHSQIICVIAHHLNPADFPKARIYACSWDQKEDTAQMRLQQAGGTEGK